MYSDTQILDKLIHIFNTFKFTHWVPVYLLNTHSQVILSLLYVFDSILTFPQDTNHVWKHHVVYKFEYLVKFIDYIDKLNKLGHL